MPRILGVDIPGDKRVDVALRYIYGLGPANSKVILEAAKIDPSIRAKLLDEQQIAQIIHAIQDGKYVVEGDLRRELGMNLKRLQAINLIGACATCVACPCEASAPRRMRARARDPARRLEWSAIRMLRWAFTRNHRVNDQILICNG